MIMHKYILTSWQCISSFVFYTNVTVQYLKKYLFCLESMKNVRSYFGFQQKISRLLKLKDLCTVWSKRFKKHVNA